MSRPRDELPRDELEELRWLRSFVDAREELAGFVCERLLAPELCARLPADARSPPPAREERSPAPAFEARSLVLGLDA